MLATPNHNAKSALFEMAAKHFGVARPVYFQFEYGPPHAKVFLCICSFRDNTTVSQGRTKAEAEQHCSQQMLVMQQDRDRARPQHPSPPNPAQPFRLSGEEADTATQLQHDARLAVISLYGDSLLRAHIARYLFDQYPYFREGIFTLIISEAVHEKTKLAVATQLHLQHYTATSAKEKLTEFLSALIGKLALVQSEQSSQHFLMAHYKSL